MNSELQKEGTASFKFESIPKGIYVIIAYQDVNGNGKTDRLSKWFDEPWETYRQTNPVIRRSSWHEIKFELNKDLKGIKIQI